MARRYSRKKGKSGSKKPIRESIPWVEMKPEELENLIVDLAKKGHPPSKIGLILRDQYGVPSVEAVLGKKLTKVLELHGLAPEIPEDLFNLIKKEVRMRKHLSTPPHSTRDVHNRERHKKVLSSIHRLSKYYRRKGVLPKNWKYTPELGNVLAG